MRSPTAGGKQDRLSVVGRNSRERELHSVSFVRPTESEEVAALKAVRRIHGCDGDRQVVQVDVACGHDVRTVLRIEGRVDNAPRKLPSGGGSELYLPDDVVTRLKPSPNGDAQGNWQGHEQCTRPRAWDRRAGGLRGCLAVVSDASDRNEGCHKQGRCVSMGGVDFFQLHAIHPEERVNAASVMGFAKKNTLCFAAQGVVLGGRTYKIRTCDQRIKSADSAYCF